MSAEDQVADRLLKLADVHKREADIMRHNIELSRYHEGKAFAYEHAARMILGTDAS